MTNTPTFKMLSVGALAALVNLVLITVLCIADRAQSLTIRNLVSVYLVSSRRAPVVHDTDTWLLNIPRAIHKFRRHPRILGVLLCSVFLLASEIIADVGVGVSLSCEPAIHFGRIILPGDVSKDRYTEIEIASVARVISRTKFTETFHTIPAGLSKRITGHECISCLVGVNASILEGCHVEEGPTFAPGSMNIRVMGEGKNEFERSYPPVEFQANDGRKFAGMGLITHANNLSACYLFTEAEGGKYMYLDYSEESQVESLFLTANTRKGNVEERARGPVRSQLVGCELNVISDDKFLQALMIYRLMMGRTQQLSKDEEENVGEGMTLREEDILRAGLSLKIADEPDDDMKKKANDTGNFYVFTECGQYDWRLAIPFISFLVVMAGCWVVGELGRRREVDVPLGSRGWANRVVEFQHGSGEREGRRVRMIMKEQGGDMPWEGVLGAVIDPRLKAECPMEYEGYYCGRELGNV